MNGRYYYILGPLVILCAWSAAAYSGVIGPLLLPPPDDAFARLVELFYTGDIWADLRATLLRWLVGFAIGVAIGCPLGLLMGYYEPIRMSLAPTVDFFRSIPVTAMFPLFLILFGIGDSSKLAIATWTAGLAVLINAMYGASHAKELRLLAAKSLGATPFQIFWKVVVPGALPQIFVGLRIAISLALVLVVASEMVLGGTRFGLGKRLYDAAMIFKTAEMYAVIFLTGILGYASNRMFLYAENKLVPWANK